MKAFISLFLLVAPALAIVLSVSATAVGAPLSDPVADALRRAEVSSDSSWAASHLADAPSFPCTAIRNSVAHILCVGRAGAAADWDLNATLWAIAGLQSGFEQKAFDQGQQHWRDSLDQRCGLLPNAITFSERQYDCILTAFHKRAEALRAQLPADALAEINLGPDQRAEIQRSLIVQNFLHEVADGEFGLTTRQAIRQFQASHSWQQTGFLSPDQSRQLQPAPQAPVTKAPPAITPPVATLQTAAAPPSSALPAPSPADPSDKMPITPAEFALFKTRIHSFWNVNLGSEHADQLVVKIEVKLTRDGRLASVPTAFSKGTSPVYLAAVDSAIAALVRAQPFEMFSQESYDSWRDMIVVFDPREYNHQTGQPQTASTDSQAFILRDPWQSKPPILLGRISSADDECELLRHPFFNHDQLDYQSTDWDPGNLGEQWLTDRLLKMPGTYPYSDISSPTQKETDDHLRDCLRSLRAAQNPNLPAIEQLLALPDEMQSGTCYPAKTTTMTSYMSPDGQILTRETVKPVPRCAVWSSIQPHVALARPQELLLMLSLDEAHPALRSLLDAADKRLEQMDADSRRD